MGPPSLQGARYRRLVAPDRIVRPAGGDLPPGVHAGRSTPQLTGTEGGHDINAHSLSRAGVRLLGRLRGIEDGSAYFSDDLAANVVWADAEACTLLASIDRLIEAERIDASTGEPPLDLRSPMPSAESFRMAPTELDLRAEGINTLIWATGYRPDYSWVRLPFLDADGDPIHRSGVTSVAGLHVLGLDWLHSADSGLFAGIDEDASYIASVIERTL